MDENNQENKKPVRPASPRRTTKNANESVREPQNRSSQRTRMPQEGTVRRTRTVQGKPEQKELTTQKKSNSGSTQEQRKTTSSQSTNRLSARKRKMVARRRQKRQMQIIAGAVIILLIVLICIIIAMSSSKNPGTNQNDKTSGVAVEKTSEEESINEEETGSQQLETPPIETQPIETQDTNLADGQTVYVTSRLNVRSRPDTTGEILGKLEAGVSVVRTADENGWSTITYNGTTAYVSSEFLTLTQPQTNNSSTSGNGTVVSYSRTWPKLADGSWDLANITNDESSVAFGNVLVGFGYSESSRDPVTKIPGDWTYYEKNWGMFNVDWIQDPALPQNQNTIYLTMDEGFPNENTAEILRILKEKNVKATFFITKTFFDGSAGEVQQMINEGHTVGNHSCTHPNMPTLSIEEQTSEIMTLHNLVKDQLGYEMKLFRFPEGSYTSRSLALVDNLGYKTAFWSYTYKDFDQNAQKDQAEALTMVLNNLHNGAIYLLHADSSTNLAILSDFIDGARERGFEFGIYPLTAN